MVFQSDEGRQIADVAARLFADMPVGADEGVCTDAVWQAIEDAGLPLALVAEAAGGFGLPLQDGLALIQLSAEHALPVPLAETMIANFLAARAGFTVLPGPLGFGFGDLRLARADGRWSLSGRVERIPWARQIPLLLLAQADDGSQLVRVDAGTTSIVLGANLAGEPRDTPTLSLWVEDARVRPAPLDRTVIEMFGAGMRSLQIAGAMRTILDMTVAYVKERNQFGRPLGNFQAIQHQVAVLASETAAARVSAQIVVKTLAGEPDVRAIAAAKIRCGEAAGRGAAIAHQVHGAMGFTKEYALHRFVRRLWSWRDEFGSEAYWSAILGRHLARAGAKGLWPELTDI